MSVIREMSPHLADLIAAGEVVERPSSVAKELVENAIDADATRVAVEIEKGGAVFLRVTDNGCGMEETDARIAFRRHATSKLYDETGLTAIHTLGFRGEALAAIAAVSRIDLFTKQKGAIAGLHLHLEAGEVIQSEEAGCPEGTTFIIRDLFYNTPARMKFLKKDFTEAGYVAAVVQHAALSHPEIAFTMVRDGKQVFSSDGKNKLSSPVFGVMGREMTQNLVEVEPVEHQNMTVYGFITKPHFGRPNRGMQHFFVNGRYVKSRLMQAALEESYRNRIITGKYPSCVLFLDMPYTAVDVNVHPAKTEVKFAAEKGVFEAVYIACKRTLEKNDNIPRILAHDDKKNNAVKEDHLTENQTRISPQSLTTPSVTPSKPARDIPEKRTVSRNMLSRQPSIECDDFDSEAPLTSLRQGAASGMSEELRQEIADETDALLQPQSAQTISLDSSPTDSASSSNKESEELRNSDRKDIERQELPDGGHEERAVQRQADKDASVDESDDAAASTSAFQPSARVIGECFHTYLIAEDADGLILIDKHAAHERMIFNALRDTAEIPQQQLLTPAIVELRPPEYAAVAEALEDVCAAGFDIEPFGTGSFAVRSAPAYLDSADISAVISEIADKLMTGRAPQTDRLDDLIHMVSCKAAIKAGKVSSLAELQDVCDRVLADPAVCSCPHGRPVTVRLTKYELDKMFKRVNQ